MSKGSTTLRLDEILLCQGLVTEEQVRTTLEYQREHGGRLGSLLMQLGFITEAQLLAALAKQFECESVTLCQMAVPAEVLAMIPANVAVARNVIPFAYDQATQVLSVACETPGDKTLLEELRFVSDNKAIKLFVAAETSLRSAITDYYATGVAPRVAIGVETEDGAGCRGTILIVTDEPDSDRPLQQAFENEAYRIISADSADDAIGLIGDHTFTAVFIRDTVPGDYIDLIDRLRKVSPGTVVRYYESPGQILLNEEVSRTTGDLIVKNMQLFTTLLATRDQSAVNHAGAVGRYVDMLCRQLGLPDKDRLNVVNAAYLHDVSRYYYGESQSAPDCRTRVEMTTKLLDTLSYPPLVIGMLRKMYIDLGDKYTRRLPIEALGGNILTIVDIFCENVVIDKRMSLDRFETVRSNLLAMSGRLFLKEVVEAFIEMIESEILIEPTSHGGTFNQVLMYCDDMDYLIAIAGRLNEEGFRAVALDNVDKFVEMYRRSHPDIMVLLQEGQASAARKLVGELVGNGVEIARVPTYLVTSRQAAAELATAIELGLEDVIPIENSLDLLTVKLQKLRTGIEVSADPDSETTIVQSNAPGTTSGSLEEMSLLELLEAMGPSCKTAKIKITSEGGKLIIGLDKGKIVYAAGANKVGAEAIYEGVSWKTGKWVVQPTSPDGLPPPNSNTSTKELLSESKRRRKQKSGTPTQ